MKPTYNIVIIEPSDVVAAGLKQIIERNNSFRVMALLHNLSDFNEFQHGNANILIINPITYNYGRTDVKSFIPNYGNFALVAITYSPYDETVLRQYDDYIGLFNSTEQIAKRLLNAAQNQQNKPQPDTSNDLSAREREILTAVAQGKTNKEIADEFNLSVYTVVSHRKNISHKLGINSISGLTIYAIINKLIDVKEF